MNFQVVKDLVAYARSIEKEKNKNFRFTLTTNGMLIDDEVIEFANRECSNVVLSLDGRKEIHDLSLIHILKKHVYSLFLEIYKLFQYYHLIVISYFSSFLLVFHMEL